MTYPRVVGQPKLDQNPRAQPLICAGCYAKTHWVAIVELSSRGNVARVGCCGACWETRKEKDSVVVPRLLAKAEGMP